MNGCDAASCECGRRPTGSAGNLAALVGAVEDGVVLALQMREPSIVMCRDEVVAVGNLLLREASASSRLKPFEA